MEPQRPLLFCVLLSLTGGVLGEVWEFGMDAPGSIIVDHTEDRFSLFEKTKEIKLRTPQCYVIEYVRVQVQNYISNPTVSFNKMQNVVTIAYKPLQYSSGGAILGGSVVWSLLRMSYYFWTSDLGVELSSSVLFLAGALLCLPVCWLSTVVPYHTKSLSLTATLMALVSVAMVMLSVGVGSIAGLSRAVREPATLNTSMLRAMAIDAFDPAVRSSFAAMQIELRCCGVQSYSDWYVHRRTLPPACCGRMWTGKNQHMNFKRGETCEVPLYSMGCLRPALAELRYFANSLSALSSGIVIVMAVTLFAAAYTLVTGVVELRAARVLKTPAPLRIACLTHPPPPLVALTSPAAMPHDTSM